MGIAQIQRQQGEQSQHSAVGITPRAETKEISRSS